jgi:hypothetical protein
LFLRIYCGLVTNIQNAPCRYRSWSYLLTPIVNRCLMVPIGYPETAPWPSLLEN